MQGYGKGLEQVLYLRISVKDSTLPEPLRDSNERKFQSKGKKANDPTLLNRHKLNHSPKLLLLLW